MENNSVSLILLKTGEKILSEIVEENETFTLTNPLQVLVYSDPSTGSQGFSFVEWIPFMFFKGKIVVPLSRTEIRWNGEASPFLCAAYIKCFENKNRVPTMGEEMDEETPPEETPTEDSGEPLIALEPNNEEHQFQVSSEEIKTEDNEWDTEIIKQFLENLPVPKYRN